MENSIENKDKNEIFHKALYITIPDDDNINGGLLMPQQIAENY